MWIEIIEVESIRYFHRFFLDNAFISQISIQDFIFPEIQVLNGAKILTKEIFFYSCQSFTDVNTYAVQSRKIIIKISFGSKSICDAMNDRYSWFLLRSPGKWVLDGFVLLRQIDRSCKATIISRPQSIIIGSITARQFSAKHTRAHNKQQMRSQKSRKKVEY